MTKVFTAGEVLTAADVNTYLVNTTGTGNAIINGAFDIWQRGTTFTATSFYSADRWFAERDGTGSTATISQQSFSPGTAPQAGYEGSFFARYDQTAAGSGATFSNFEQKIEDVRTFAGQTITVSFWAKADSARVLRGVSVAQSFGSGGSASVFTTSPDITLSTNWTRYSETINVPSISGKTIGASSVLRIIFRLPLNTTQTIDIWGVQVEAGPVATPFKRNANSLQGELAACQRYYYRAANASSTFGTVATGLSVSTTQAACFTTFPVQMRIKPASIEFASLLLVDGVGTITITDLTLDANVSSNSIGVTNVSGTGQTQFRPMYLRQNTAPGGFLAFSAEL
jgi:hypothetical protein